MMVGEVGSLLVKVSLILICALLIDVCLRRRHVLALAAFWNASLLAILVLPLAAMLFPQWTLPLPPYFPAVISAAEVTSLSSLATDQASDKQRPTPSEPSVVESFPAHNSPRLTVIGWIYILVLTFLCTRLLFDLHSANSLRRHAAPVTDSLWCERLAFWRARQNMAEHQSHNQSDLSPTNAEIRQAENSRIKLLESQHIDVPMVIGVRDPAIVIPSSMAACRATQAIDSVLTHELAHIYRADCAWQLVQRGVEAVLWFHPLVWLARRRIVFVRERACDDFAVRLIGDFRVYGEALLDVASGMIRRRSLGVGLAMARATTLARRLEAITHTTGNNRCVAPRRARWLITMGMLCLTAILGCVALGGAVADEIPVLAPAKKNPTSIEEVPKAPSIELLAVTWQQVPENNDKPIDQPVWRPDGKKLSATEVKALLDEIKSFQSHWWNQKEELRPLVFIFRAPSEIHTGIGATVVLPNGRRSWSGTHQYPTPGGLAKSSCSPRREDLLVWPAKVDLDLKVPVENPQVVKSIDSVPEAPVEIEAGVRWYIDEKAGINFSQTGSPQSGFTAAVLELPRSVGGVDSLTTYAAQVWVRGDKTPLSESHATLRPSKDGEEVFIRVSRVINDPKAIVRVEITRQRFRFERIEAVETRPDLIPSEK